MSTIYRYDRRNVISFCKANQPYGELANTTNGFPIIVNDREIPSTEAFYQACRYPDYPDIQEKIISVKTAMGAKLEAHKYLDKTRSDWLPSEHPRVSIMRYAVRLKYLCHYERLHPLLTEGTDGKHFVEFSYKDNFWGAIPEQDGYLVGQNYLGRLWEEIEVLNMFKEAIQLKPLEAPMNVPNMLWLEEPIRPFLKRP